VATRPHVRDESIVTLKGSWWLAREPTSARPGTPDDAWRAWQLTVKRGVS